MTDNTYNGWANRATWLVNIWFNPETKDQVEMIKEDLEQTVADLANSGTVCNKFLADLINLQEVDWDELKEHMEEEEEA
jgi:hypothetical protein